MANFDLDDPLGDLLSDGSDDSFFDEPKTIAKRSSISRSPEKKNVDDLFGLKETKSSETKKSDDWLGLEKKEPEIAMRRKKISFEEDDGILNSLGLDATQNNDKMETKKTDTAKKSSLLESILKPAPKEEDKKFLSLDDLLKESKLSKKADVPPEVTQSTSHLPPKTTTTYGMSSSEGPREGRRGRPKTAGMADPLGLFSGETKSVENVTENAPKVANRRNSLTMQKDDTEILFHHKQEQSKDVPDWLGGSTSVKQSKSEASDVDKSINAQTTRRNSIIKVPGQSEAITVPNELLNVTNPSIDNLLTQQKLTASHVEYQNTSIALQQQESQLLIALQLKKYEENLCEMQRKQQDVLIKQEQQFNSLLERQFSKQQMLENNMRMQQERINSHIQMLIAQPHVTSSNEDMERVNELKKTNSDEMMKHFEDMLNNLKQRQHEEMFLLEESYKKQITTLEQSMESVENHLKMELDGVTQKHREKIEQIETEHEADASKYKKKIEELHKLHEIEMKQMRENINRVVDEIKYEYNCIIENLKASKQNELGIKQDSHLFSDRLDTSIKLLDINYQSLHDLREKVSSDYGVLSKAREESLKAKQEEINMMRIALEKAREAADNERAELMSLVRNLEMKLAEQSQNAREERYALQQASATLVARASAMEREAEFNRASLEREREQLKTLRETLQAEQEKGMQQITEEKLSLYAERVKLETSAKLNQNYDVQKVKMEMETAMEVAKEATERTDRERENLLKQIREVESLKRALTDKEQKISLRERDVDAAIEMANRKNIAGEKALDEARMLQLNYNERLREIQAQVASLNARERKLAEAKIGISKERLQLHNNAKQMKKCGLCAVDNSSNRFDDDENFSEHAEHDIPHFISISDADMFRLQLQMSEDQLINGEDHVSVH